MLTYTEVLTATLPFVMPALNRARGGDHKYFNVLSLSFSASLIIAFMIGHIVWVRSGADVCPGAFYLAAFSLYMLGENWGWGKWVGGIVTYHHAGEKAAAWAIENNSDDTLWIHSVVSRMLNPAADPLNYCLAALFLRGLYWWLPLFSFFAYVDPGRWTAYVFAMIAMAAAFPVSVYYSNRFDFEFMIEDAMTPTERYWANGEFLYGWLQGIILFALWF